MNVHVSPHAPAPGATSPGDMYVELATRTMWIGVDTAVDSSGSVLLSDILAIQPAIDDGVALANDYTDTQVLTRAPTVHTHTASQITDFTAAVNAVVGPSGGQFTRGMVMMYSGSLANIGTGTLAGWALCDGTNGTPDLRDKFVLGAGNRPTGVANAGDSFNTTAGGAHDHSINPTAITAAQMPSHAHGSITGYMSHDHAHAVNIVTDAQGNHQHSYWASALNINADGNGSRAGPGIWRATEYAGNHSHNVSGWTGGVNTNHYHGVNAEGGNQGHTHTTVSGGGLHQHTITGAQMREALPYLTLAYIMKL